MAPLARSVLRLRDDVATRRPSRAVPRLARLRYAVGLAALALSACTYFPKHEEVYIPIPLNIGEARIENGDTVWVLEETGYRIIAPREQILADVRHDFEAAVRQFQRYFDAMPDRATVRYVDTLEVRDPTQLPSPELNGAQFIGGEILLPARGMGRLAREPNAPPPYRATPAVARFWLRSHALRLAGDSGAATVSRAPAWISSAMADMIVSGNLSAAAGAAWRDRNELVPLRELFAMDSLLTSREPGRRPSRGDLERWSRLRLQSALVASFIAEREDPRFLGELAERLFAGASMEDAMRGAESLPSDLDRFEEQWRNWVRERAGR